jgi:hypothetical protein
MIEGDGVLETGGGDGGNGGGDGGDGGNGGGGGSAPEWLGALPEELRGDQTLTRFADVEALARGHIEAHKVAKSKLVIPAADAPPEQWGAVYDQLGRPADAKDYEIPLPEGQEDTSLADAFKPVAHGLGLLPGQAKGVAEFFNGQVQAAQDSYFAKGEEEITALRGELGDEYDVKKAGAQAIYKKLGFPPEFADELDQKVGSAGLLRGFMKLAELTGEHGRIDGDALFEINAGDANAAAQLKELQKDKGWREKLNSGDATVKAQHERLLAAAKRQGI